MFIRSGISKTMNGLTSVRFRSILSLTRVHFKTLALAGVAQWTKLQPADCKVASSIPGQGTCLGCGRGPQLGACKKQPMYVFLPLFLPLFPSLSTNKPTSKLLKTLGY